MIALCRWYSYDYGSMHFIQINTETDFPSSPMGPGTYYGAGPFGNQLAWLEADLEAAAQNRKSVPWIVVSGHRPWYTSGGKCTACSAAFEALLVKYDVDIYFSGHVHWSVSPGGRAAFRAIERGQRGADQAPVLD